MPKITLTDYKKEYEKLTGKKASQNWTIAQCQKKIKLYQAEKQIEKDMQNKPDTVTQTPNPAFEAALDGSPSTIAPDVPTEPVETRGGFREGAGRPAGQTDKRARIEALMQLEVPDLAVQQILRGLNLPLAKFTPIPFTEEQIDSIALGITLPLYYWFPNLQGRADVVTLHLTAASLVGAPFIARTASLKEIQLKKESEKKNDKTESENSTGESVKETGNIPGANSAGNSNAGKKSKTGSKGKIK
jgi:hypothetical protein